MEKRVVITGVNGFVGHHLTSELKNHNNIEVIGIGTDPLPADDLKNSLDNYISTDLTKEWPTSLEAVDAVVHLAGLAAVGPSFDHPQQYIETNSSMVTHLGEFYLQQSKKPRILIVSSGAIYDSNQPIPLTEKSPVGFSSPYSVSKVLVENQAAYYKNRGLDMVVARPFNHIGPGQRTGFILPDLYKKLSDARANGSEQIFVGNLESKRDYTDVRDIVAAYALLITTPSLAHTVYNVSSGKSYSGTEILAIVKQKMGLGYIQPSVDPSLFRPTDAPDITGDSLQLQQELNWRPSFSIEETIADFVTSQQS